MKKKNKQDRPQNVSAATYFLFSNMPMRSISAMLPCYSMQLTGQLGSFSINVFQEFEHKAL
jgi:hypothetical protein